MLFTTLCGIVIADDKQYLVKSRLEPILRTNGLASYEVLVQQLRTPDSLLLRDQTIEAITTNETSFNRDGHPFEDLRRIILPELANRLIERRGTTRPPHSKARIWCAAVSTGQEAYSVAMAVADFLAARSTPGLTLDDFPILASDISSRALASAREADIPPRARSRTDRAGKDAIFSPGKRSLGRRRRTPPNGRIPPTQSCPAAARPRNF